MSTNNSPIYTENTVAELEKYNFSYDNISKGLAIVMIAVSYTHLTLPTKRIV